MKNNFISFILIWFDFSLMLIVTRYCDLSWKWFISRDLGVLLFHFVSFLSVFFFFFFLAFCFFFLHFQYVANYHFFIRSPTTVLFREHERNKILRWLLHRYEKDNVFYFKKLYSLTKDKKDNTNSVLQKRETIKKKSKWT